MSVAGQLELDSIEASSFVQARRWWTTTIVEEPDLGVVADLADLSQWTRRASRAECDVVLAWLAERALDDREAALVLAWLLVPGATRIAERHSDLSVDIDQLVAGQLWLEIRTHGGNPGKAVAFTILQRTKRAVLADLGVGDGAQRQDPAWANTVVTDRLAERTVPVVGDEPDAAAELRVLIEQMLRDGELTPHDARTLISSGTQADWFEAPLRGRAGVTAPAALEVLTWLEPTKARTMRRTLVNLLDRVAAYARAHGTLHDDEALRTARDSEWTINEFVMIVRDPLMAQRLRLFHQHMLLIDRCRQGHRAADQDGGIDQCPCPESGECGAWIASA